MMCHHSCRQLPRSYHRVQVASAHLCLPSQIVVIQKQPIGLFLTVLYPYNSYTQLSNDLVFQNCAIQQ